MILNRFKWLIPILVLTYFATGCASTSKAPESKSNQAKLFEAPDDKGTVFYTVQAELWEQQVN